MGRTRCRVILGMLRCGERQGNAAGGFLGFRSRRWCLCLWLRSCLWTVACGVVKLAGMTKTMLKDTAERALSTFAQTLIALIGTDGAGILDVSLVDSVNAALVAGLLSVLKAVAAIKGPIGDSTASLVNLDEA